MARASRCSLSKTVRKSAPRTSTSAAASLIVLRKEIGVTIRAPRITTSRASPSSTPSNSR